MKLSHEQQAQICSIIKEEIRPAEQLCTEWFRGMPGHDDVSSEILIRADAAANAVIKYLEMNP